jgi:acyl-CoA synthetase (AMP-forming)/AMP-acid ligase II
MLEIIPNMPETMPEDTVVDMVRRVARVNPDRDAVVCDGTRLSWAAFDTAINKAANMLIARGVTRGDRVAVLAPNSIAYAVLFMGILRAGGCVVPLSTMASTTALEKMVKDCGARVFCLAETYRELVPFIDAMDITRIALDFEADGFEAYAQAMDDADTTDPMVPVGMGDGFNLIYSSGTTGTPKGILHTHFLRAAQMDRVTANGYDDAARTLLSTPLYSNTTIVAFLPTLVGGSTAILMSKFDAQGWLALAEAEAATHTMLVPVQYKRIVELPEFADYDLSAMRLKLSTSAPLRADVKQKVLAQMPGKLVEYYGLTEGGGVTVLIADENPDKLHTVGKPAPHCDIRLIGVDGVEVAPGEVGEICGRSPTMMAGYYGRDDLTEETLWRNADGDVYLRSGDMGSFDADGFLVLSDRKKDMIISGGLNIYANDLELILLADPDVTDAAVIGVPSEAWGETPLGLVVLREGSVATGEDIRARANEKLGKSHRLSAVEVRDVLPRSSIGKILKKDLRAAYWP